MKKTNQIELLAPAGSYDTLKAVIAAGADAVYAGGSRFGARAYAENFTKEELLDAVDYAHLYGRRIYLTVNTLLKQGEMDSLYEYLLPYYEQGLDAVIIQDFGVLQLIRSCFPDLSIHISTQMSAADAYGAAYLKSLGASRVVPARELSLEEIRAIKSRTDMEIECFVHGALCYCYSGQCLLSSMLGGRSGNRGRCAQPCRLPYTVLDASRKAISRPEVYPLSPKDLCTVGLTARLAEAGIDSFKIEGRMKSAEYAAEVTAVYRKYLDEYFQKGAVTVQEKDAQRLLDAGSRSGFTDGYYTRHNGREMITMNRPAYEKRDRADKKKDPGEPDLQQPKIPVLARTYLKAGQPPVLNLSCRSITASASCGLVQAAKKQPASREEIKTQLSKTGNTPFVMEAVQVTMDDAVFIPKQTLNQLRRDALDQLYSRMLQPFQKRAGAKAPQEAQPEECSPVLREAQPEEYAAAPCFSAVIEERDQLAPVLECGCISRVYLDSLMYTRGGFSAQLKADLSAVKNAGKQAYLSLPFVFRKKTAEFYEKQLPQIEAAGIDGYLAKNMDELGFLHEMHVDKNRCMLDHSLYACSNRTKEAYAAAGWKYDTIPLELNQKELQKRINQNSELLIYGRMPLMISAQCIYHTLGRCRKRRGLCYLKDRYGKEFPVRNNCSECVNVLYNAQPLSLIQLSDSLFKLQPASCRLWFTIETQKEVQKILDSLVQSFFEHRIPDMGAITGGYTKGHYKRGAE